MRLCGGNKMKLLFNENTIEYIDSPFVEEIIQKTNELLKDEFYFSHYIADGVEVNETPELFLEKNILKINTLEIIALQAKEFVDTLLLSAEEYTNRAVPYIKELVDEFYNSPSPTSWKSLGELFEGIQWLSSMINLVDQSIVRPITWDSVMEKASIIQDELESFEEALESADTVLIADLLQYEILPVFEELQVTMKLTIDTEGTRHDLN